MKVNNNNVLISEMQTENIDGELIVYNQREKKIIVFNKTASLIWKTITTFDAVNADITTDSIAEKVMEAYKIPAVERENIYNDVNDIISQFLHEKLIAISCDEQYLGY